MKYLCAIFCIALLTGCQQGQYLGGLLWVNPPDKSDAAFIEQDTEDAYRAEGKRESYWGECDYWKEFHIKSHNDVDTAYNKLRRYQVTDVYTLPQSKNATLNRKMTQAWSSPEEQAGLHYVMPPRFSIVKVGKFEQKGLVAYQISKNNTGSFIDVAYCVGVEQYLGFYIPHTIEPEFEPTLRMKFISALR